MAAATVGGSLLGGLFGSSSAKKAAKAQQQAAQLAADTQMRMFNTVNDQQKPFREAGYTSLNALMGGMGIGPAVAGGPTSGSLNKPFSAEDLSQWQDPGYQFRLNQGMGALQNSQAATSGLVSGNSLRSLMDYGQNSASQEYQNAFNRYNTNQSNIYNRLSNIAGLGQTSVDNTTQAGMTTAGNIGSAQMAGGAAQAAGYIGQSNAITGALNNATGWYLGGKQAGLF
jgi:hypothetical protein